MLHMFISYTSLSLKRSGLWVETDPGADPLTLPTSETSSDGVSWEAVRSWIFLAVGGKRWIRRCTTDLCLCCIYFRLVIIQSLTVDSVIKAPFFSG